MSTITADIINLRRGATTWYGRTRIATGAQWRISGYGCSIYKEFPFAQRMEINREDMAIHVFDDSPFGSGLKRATLDHTGATVFPVEKAATPSARAEDDRSDATEDLVDGQVIIEADALLVTDGATRIYSRFDGDGIHLYDAAGQMRAEIANLVATFQRPTDADPNLIEFLNITENVLAIATLRRGEFPQVKCTYFHDGVVVIHEAESASVRAPLLPPRRHAQSGPVYEAQEFLVGDAGRFDKDGFQIRGPTTGTALTVDGMLIFHNAGVCRTLCIRWDGVYFFDTNGQLLSKLTANGFEQRSEGDSRLEAFLAERRRQLA